MKCRPGERYDTVTTGRLLFTDQSAVAILASARSTQQQCTLTCNGLHVEVPYARAGLRQDNLLSVTTRDKRRSGCRSYKGHQVGVSESE